MIQSNQAFLKQLQGEQLITAEILYRMPDYRSLLQIFVWQEYDHAPRFPRLIKFLDYWSHNLDGPLADVRVSCAGLLRPATLRHIGHEWRLN
jgi:uncharacterized protein Usg